MDPELPMVSIVDLGMVGRVEVDADGIEVELLPTFVGCPALELIRSAVVNGWAPSAPGPRSCRPSSPPWSSERITPAGRAALAIAGIAPPAPAGAGAMPAVWLGRGHDGQPVRPHAVPLALDYCRDCRQPFEAIKPI